MFNRLASMTLFPRLKLNIYLPQVEFFFVVAVTLKIIKLRLVIHIKLILAL